MKVRNLCLPAICWGRQRETRGERGIEREGEGEEKERKQRNRGRGVGGRGEGGGFTLSQPVFASHQLGGTCTLLETATLAPKT